MIDANESSISQKLTMKKQHLFISLLAMSMSLTSHALIASETITQESCLAGDTFHKAAANGNLSLVKQCLNTGISVDAVENNGWTALHTAAKHGQLAIIEQLLQSKASLFIEDKNGNTALAIAQLAKQQATVERLQNARKAAIEAQAKTAKFVEIPVSDPQVKHAVEEVRWELNTSGPLDPFNPGDYTIIAITHAQQKVLLDKTFYRIKLDIDLLEGGTLRSTGIQHYDVLVEKKPKGALFVHTIKNLSRPY